MPKTRARRENIGKNNLISLLFKIEKIDTPEIPLISTK